MRTPVFHFRASRLDWRYRTRYAFSSMRCPNCGFPIDRRNLPAVCPKCDEDLVLAKARKPLVIDLAHRGESVSQALAKLDAAVSECMWHGHPSLKVIHGHGSDSGVSRIKPQVLNLRIPFGGRPRFGCLGVTGTVLLATFCNELSPFGHFQVNLIWRHEKKR